MLTKKTWLILKTKFGSWTSVTMKLLQYILQKRRRGPWGLWSMACFLPEQAWLAGLLWPCPLLRRVFRSPEKLDLFDERFQSSLLILAVSASHWWNSEIGLLQMVYSNGHVVNATHDIRRLCPPFVNGSTKDFHFVFHESGMGDVCHSPNQTPNKKNIWQRMTLWVWASKKKQTL